MCGLQATGHLLLGYVWQGKPLPPSQTLEVGVAFHDKVSMNRHHLWPQSTQGSVQRRALKPSTTCCCSEFPGNVHALLLPLPNAMGAAYSCLRVAATSQGLETRSSLHLLPTAPCHCQGPNNQTLVTSFGHCLILPGSMQGCTPVWG